MDKRMGATKKQFLFIVMFVSLFFLACTPSTAQKTMNIEIMPSNSIISGENFTVSVYDPNITNETPYLTDVIIVFNGDTYPILLEDASGEISIQTPHVLTNTTYVLEAYKEGYTTANTTITVIPKESLPSYELHITVTTDTVQAHQQFTVLVTDLHGESIEGATVYIQEAVGNGQFSITDDTGEAILTAPNHDEITLISAKQGYKQAELTIWVMTQPSVFEVLFYHPYFPVAIAVLILITVIIYVSKKNKIKSKNQFHLPRTTLREKRLPTNRGSDHVTSEDFSSKNEKNIPNNLQQHNTKIEEIHIPPSDKTKEVISLQELGNKPVHQSTDSYHWFEKPSEVDIKVDNLTDPVSEKNKEKWFIGTDDLRKKIDETIKEKDKKHLKKD